MMPKHEEGPLRVMLEDEFRKEFVDAPNRALLKNIVYVQTCVKIKHGIGESIIETYYSHLHTDTSAIEKLKAAGNQTNLEEEEYLMNTDPKEYCMMVCRRIAYFFAIFMKLELLRIQAEFLKDDNGKIWLIHATQIAMREINVPDLEDEIKIEQQALVPPEFADDFKSELKEYNEDTGAMTARASALMGILDDHYAGIKHQSGVNELLKAEPPNTESNYAFAKLRPTSPYTMQQLLDPKMEYYRAKRWLFPASRPKSQISLQRPTTGSYRTPLAGTLRSGMRSTQTLGWTQRKKLKISPQKSKNSVTRYVPSRYSNRVSTWSRTQPLGLSPRNLHNF